MIAPVEFVKECETIYAIGSKGDRYEIRLESPGVEAFCACDGFKWQNTDVRRDSRPNRAIVDCRHLSAARERATNAWVRPRFRLYHPPSESVLADKFQSIEAMAYLLDPATTVITFPLVEVEIQRFDESKNAWIVLRMAGATPIDASNEEAKSVARAPRRSKKEPPPEPPKEEGPKIQEYYCRSCEAITPASEWIEDRCPKCSRPYDYKGQEST